MQYKVGITPHLSLCGPLRPQVEQLCRANDVSECLHDLRRNKLGKLSGAHRVHFVSTIEQLIPHILVLGALTCLRYDYGAPIREDRSLTPKYSEMKLQAGFLHASPDFLVATRFGNGTVGSGTAFSDNARIFTTGLSSPSGTHFYVVRQASVRCVCVILSTGVSEH